YIGIENESRIETRTGAALDVAANLFFNTGILVPNIGVSIPILNISPLLESVTDFTHFVEAVIDPNDDVTLNPAAHTGNASADFSIAVVEAGVGGQVGVFQRFVYDPSAVVATVTALHLRTGTLISQELGIDALDRSISFHLNRGGHWQIAIEELSLWATLQQEWGIRVGGQVFGKVLGIGPVWDLVLDAPFPERPAPVDLVFDQVPYLGSFVVNVIPVPAAGWLLGSAVMLLAGLRRGRS
ncbi:MAG: hypothetical protein HKO62_09375, partial [Gammaproteobacteria bacterium]|nr:hypothetical protein [Gammaproteobacteria bacterium]